MKDLREEKNEILFRAIGMVSDRYLGEAMRYRRSRGTWTRFAGIAAAILLVLSLGFGIRTLLPQKPSAGNETNLPSANIGIRIEETLRGLGSDRYTALSVTEKKHFALTKEAYLVWQYAGQETFYRSHSLTDAEVSGLCRAMASGAGSLPDASSEDPAFRIWLVLEDGEVLTPYLPLTAGNTGYATLFDYRAECVPAESFLRALLAVFGENT